MQDKSAAGSGFTLRVAASFNTTVKTAPAFGLRWTLRDKAPRSPLTYNVSLLNH